MQTIDFFSPVVDDPFVFGQIAATNALSDVYAMGGRPLFALNIAGFPNTELPLEVLHEILRGGAEKAKEAGIPILGGHTVQDAEPKYGLVVTGVVDPARIARNVGAKPGDLLVLTKPLGTGIVSNAVKRGECPLESMEAAVRSMTRLNRDAAEAMLEVGIDACTDVTGFGLVGHLRGMLVGSGVAARLQVGSFPLLPQVRELAEKGFVPGGSKRNRDFHAPHVEVRGASEVDVVLANDAQTSGGLLISVAEERLATLIEALERRGTLAAARIGEVFEGPAGRVVLEP